MPEQKPNSKAYIALVVGILVIGTSAILTRWAAAPGSVVSLYRMSIGTLVLAVPFASARLRSKKALPRRGLWLAIIAGIFFGLDLAAWATGITYSGATIPTLLGNTAPLWVGLGAWFLFRENLKPSFWVGLGLAMLGALIVLGLESLSSGFTFDKGGLFGLLGSLFYGAYMLVTQRGRGHLDTLTFFWISALSSSITLLLICQIIQAPLTGYSSFTWFNFIALGVLVQGGAWMAINYAQGHLPASMVSPSLLSQPLITAIIAGPLLGEWLTPVEWLGAVAVLVGIIIVHRSRQPIPVAESI
jgi:drug/metabolite transporter (DMT)-like permease